MSAPAIRLDLPNPRLRLVDPLPCKNAPNGWNHRGANDAGNVMAERTTKAPKGKKPMAESRTVLVSKLALVQLVNDKYANGSMNGQNCTAVDVAWHALAIGILPETRARRAALGHARTALLARPGKPKVGSREEAKCIRVALFAFTDSVEFAIEAETGCSPEDLVEEVSQALATVASGYTVSSRARAEVKIQALLTRFYETKKWDSVGLADVLACWGLTHPSNGGKKAPKSKDHWVAVMLRNRQKTR